MAQRPVNALMSAPETPGSRLQQGLANALMGLGFSNYGAHRQAGRAVNALMALTPLGLVEDAADYANEQVRRVRGGRQWQRPGAGESAVAALAALPAGRVGKGIIAYHGSPHKFDRFDMSKIGSGEGAQAYGHGLYFAEQEAVARQYRDVLAGANREYKLGGKSFDPSKLPPQDNFAFMTAAQNPGKSVDELLAMIDDNTGLTMSDEALSAMRQRLTPYAGAAAITEAPKGAMYQVRINADPNDFLDWDAPLIAQPQSVREAIARAKAGGDEMTASLLGDLSDPEAMTMAGLFPKSSGAQVYNTLTNNQKEAATEKLRQAGIPGIKYLDAGSRGVGEGSRNYVVFDDKLIEILKRYGWAPGAVLTPVLLDRASKQYEQETGRPVQMGPES